jgi:hypothetical protein
MPKELQAEFGTAQPQKWARCSTTVFPKMFMFREKQSQVPPVPENDNVTPPPPRTAAPLILPLYIINSLQVEGAGVSPSEHPAYLAPAL